MDYNEYLNAVNNLGYSPEGVACQIFPTVDAGASPLFRLYSGGGSDHFYTASASEAANAATNLGYTMEGIVGYIFADDSCGGIPFYRLYQASTIDHFYTTSAQERDNAAQHLGYGEEGIAGYVIPAWGNYEGHFRRTFSILISNLLIRNDPWNFVQELLICLLPNLPIILVK